MRRDPAATHGLALPLVLVLASACHLAVGSLLEAVQGEMNHGTVLGRSADALAAAERVLNEAIPRLQGAPGFPATGCAAGLCANRQSPSSVSYDWPTGTAHTTSSSVISGGYWVELLGVVAAGQSTDCSGSSGGCEYVRVIASAAPTGIRRTLEACYRIHRTANAPPQVARISWRETNSP